MVLVNVMWTSSNSEEKSSNTNYATGTPADGQDVTFVGSIMLAMFPVLFPSIIQLPLAGSVTWQMMATLTGWWHSMTFDDFPDCWWLLGQLRTTMATWWLLWRVKNFCDRLMTIVTAWQILWLLMTSMRGWWLLWHLDDYSDSCWLQWQLMTTVIIDDGNCGRTLATQWLSWEPTMLLAIFGDALIPLFNESFFFLQVLSWGVQFHLY